MIKIVAALSCFKKQVFLDRVCVQYSTSETPRVSVRGRESGVHRGCYSFTWSRAVRALTVLLVSSKGRLNSESEERGALSGGKGSLAASLDYAISKQPMWLTDIFGTNADGTLRVRRLILRSNPERKRGDIVALHFNPSIFGQDSVELLLNNQPVVDNASVDRLLTALSSDDGVMREPAEPVFPVPVSVNELVSPQDLPENHSAPKDSTISPPFDTEVSAFMWFPHVMFASCKNAAVQPIWSSWSVTNRLTSLSAIKAGSSVLLVRSDIFSQRFAKALSLSIRDAWRTMVESPALEASIARDLATDALSQKHLRRVHSNEFGL